MHLIEIVNFVKSLYFSKKMYNFIKTVHLVESVDFGKITELVKKVDFGKNFKTFTD